jgi:hypothetical protein
MAIMLRTIPEEYLAWIKTAVHVAAAMTIMWYFYRIANGQFSLL